MTTVHSYTSEQVKRIFKTASEQNLSPYMGYTDEPLVSSDYIGCSKSAVIASYVSIVRMRSQRSMRKR
ncbi:glyceraldehyde-3-phosphate dehydrogenase [Paenibacillus sp. N3.4]|uniref:glyceraldehyde-3-phosphate dehydrogenase n=1 Tax=Paenibacillus sp. N3.4 TaxID=2603222 RepID=UPI0011C9541F|nr:glyceraldehyde-3-phosphate dehydrogenase [Paenibacillus sp. N3.4]TXK79103.1 hypothetical protein FU659_20030 [Paenibacillus sp. N3.4]